jgi:peptidoglycan hydrolase-like protein with peptidoglycan-binding domain
MPSLSDKIAIPPKAEMNPNLSAAREDTMLSVFGRPGRLTQDCSDPTGAFAARVITRNVGPFRVTGLNVAVESLERIFTEVRAQHPNVFNEVKTEGMLCVRHRRTNPSRFSNHSWGCALDLFFGSDVVAQGEPRAHRGNVILFPFFNRHGWYWGAEFSGSSVDSMHFELAEETILKIARDERFDEGTGGGGRGPTTGPLRHPTLAANADLQAAALGERAFMRGRDHGEPVGIIQDALDRILPPGERINAGVNRGTFGPRTEAAVRRFQRESNLFVDGLVGRDTLLALDAELMGLSPEGPPADEEPESGSLDEIIEIAANSRIARHRWTDRGRAPLGYTKGMALVFTRTLCKLKGGDEFATEMAKADTGNASRDGLTWYRQRFNSLGMDNSVSGPDTLRHLFVLLMGLGMRESSGNYCEGRDTTADNTTADTAEAGLFQTSFNARSSSPLLPRLFNRCNTTPDTDFADVFKEGARCSASDFDNFGTGPGREFQRLSKECPAFAVEFAAIALRNMRRHWGPITRREAEVLPDCDAMFREVQDLVESSNLCPAFV